MRQTAVRLNRAWLTVVGVVLLLAGLAGLLVAVGQAGPLLSRTGTGWRPPTAGSHLFGSATAAALGLTWVVVVTGLVGLVLGLLGLAWLVAQVPRQNAAGPFRLQDEARTGLTRVDAHVLSDAVEAQTKQLPGVTAASAVLRGSVARPDLTLKVTADDRTDIPGLLDRLHHQVARDLGVSLDTRLRRLGVQVEISSAKVSSNEITVGSPA